LLIEDSNLPTPVKKSFFLVLCLIQSVISIHWQSAIVLIGCRDDCGLYFTAQKSEQNGLFSFILKSAKE